MLRRYYLKSNCTYCTHWQGCRTCFAHWDFAAFRSLPQPIANLREWAFGPPAGTLCWASRRRRPTTDQESTDRSGRTEGSCTRWKGPGTCPSPRAHCRLKTRSPWQTISQSRAFHSGPGAQFNRTIFLEFWLEKPSEFWLKISTLRKSSKMGSSDMSQNQIGISIRFFMPKPKSKVFLLNRLPV